MSEHDQQTQQPETVWLVAKCYGKSPNNLGRSMVSLPGFIHLVEVSDAVIKYRPVDISGAARHVASAWLCEHGTSDKHRQTNECAHTILALTKPSPAPLASKAAATNAPDAPAPTAGDADCRDPALLRLLDSIHGANLNALLAQLAAANQRAERAEAHARETVRLAKQERDMAARRIRQLDAVEHAADVLRGARAILNGHEASHLHCQSLLDAHAAKLPPEAKP